MRPSVNAGTKLTQSLKGPSLKLQVRTKEFEAALWVVISLLCQIANGCILEDTVQSRLVPRGELDSLSYPISLLFYLCCGDCLRLFDYQPHSYHLPRLFG